MGKFPEDGTVDAGCLESARSGSDTASRNAPLAFAGYQEGRRSHWRREDATDESRIRNIYNNSIYSDAACSRAGSKRSWGRPEGRGVENRDGHRGRGVVLGRLGDTPVF